MKQSLLPALVLLLLYIPPVWTQEKKQPPPQPTPTAAKVAYGDRERQVLDFWQAKSDQPAPLVLYIHGGAWQNGDKSGLGAAAIKGYLDAGISVAAINYRYVKNG